MKRLALAFAVLALAACGSGAYQPKIDPARFTSAITNPYLPFAPGQVFQHRAVDDGKIETVTLTVLAEKKKVMGVANSEESCPPRSTSPTGSSVPSPVVAGDGALLPVQAK